MKLESQITNNHSSLIDNQSKRRSTPVENVRQITPFYAKQTQFKPNNQLSIIDNQLKGSPKGCLPNLPEYLILLALTNKD